VKKTAGEKKRKENKRKDTAQCLSEDGSLAGFDQVLAWRVIIDAVVGRSEVIRVTVIKCSLGV